MGVTVRTVYRTQGVSGELQMCEEKIPKLLPGEVCIAVKAISLNYRDLLYIDSVPQDRGLIPGSDTAGVVEAIGEGVYDFQPGDRVVPSFFTAWTTGRYQSCFRSSALGGGREGVFTSHVIVPAACLVRMDHQMSFREAATLPCAAVTAWNALLGRGRVQSGDIVLIQGTGGVALFAIQFAQALGATPLVLSGSRDKISRLEAMGVERFINYRETKDWEHAVMRATNGYGVDHIVELVGNSNLARSINCLRCEGTISYIGCLSGFEGSFDPLQLMYKNANLQAIYVGSRADLEKTACDVKRFEIAPMIDSRQFAFNKLPEALEFLRRGSHFGKVVIDL